MGVFEILLIVFCVVFVLAVIVCSILRRKNGKGGCGCDCCSGDCHLCKYSSHSDANKN